MVYSRQKTTLLYLSQEIGLSAASFNVVYNAFLASFGNFAFTSGLPLTIGLIISIVSSGFQFASSREAEDRRAKSDLEAEKRRQQSEKSKWMVENAKYYLNLFGETRRIYTYFPKQDTKDLPYYDKFYDKRFDKLTQDILYHVIRFYSSYVKFVDEFNMYYFNDLRTENFLSRLDGKIISMYNQIFGDSSKLLQFSEKSKWEFENDYKIKDLLDDFEKWISEKDRDKISNATNVEIFLYLHLIYGTVLFVAINEMVHELYAKEIEHKNAVFNIVKENYETLKVGLDVVNKHIYNDVTSSYFHLMFNGEDLIKE
jgi:hypothetical protein